MVKHLLASEVPPLLEVALAAAVAGGAAIMTVRERGYRVTYKDDASPLTEADLAANDIIMDHLTATGLPVLSEESREVPYAERAGWERFWLVDPLDGTKEFVKDTGEFTVNIALVEDGRPVLGVVLAPVLDTVYWGVGAADRREAFKTDRCLGAIPAAILARAEPLRIDHAAAVQPPLEVVASRSHCNEDTVRFIDQLEAAYGEVRRVSRGSSLKLCLIAEGAASIYPRIAPTMEWDTAAAQAVVEAAGGGVYAYDPQVPATGYFADRPADSGLQPLRYNKENLLNPFFVVC